MRGYGRAASDIVILFEAGFDEPIIRCTAEIAASPGIPEEIVLFTLERDRPFQCFGIGAGLVKIQQRLDQKCIVFREGRNLGGPLISESAQVPVFAS